MQNTVSSFWHPISDHPDNECWCHILIRYYNPEQGRIEYSTEPDCYAVELARRFHHKPGFCKANRWPEREKMVAWHHFPDCTDALISFAESGTGTYSEGGYLWHPACESPVYEGMYHILCRITDKKSGETYYRIKQDLFAVDIAKGHGHPVGFCDARIPDRLTILAWCRFPEIPDAFTKDATRQPISRYRDPGWSHGAMAKPPKEVTNNET